MKLTASFMRGSSSVLQPLLNLGLRSHAWYDTVFLWIELDIPFLVDDTLVVMVTRGLVDEGRCGIVPQFTRNAAATGELVDNNLQG